MGDWVKGSGEVPHDELGPTLEFVDAEGELVDVSAPMLTCESRLAREALAMLAFVNVGLKRLAEKLAKSSLARESNPILL